MKGSGEEEWRELGRRPTRERAVKSLFGRRLPCYFRHGADGKFITHRVGRKVTASGGKVVKAYATVRLLAASLPKDETLWEASPTPISPFIRNIHRTCTRNRGLETPPT